MKSTLDCIPCFIEHALHVAKMATDDQQEQFEIVRKTLALVSTIELERTPPEMAREIHRIIKEVTGIDDPYRGDKDRSTAFALKILPLLREEIRLSEDPFDTLIRLVIAGNIIDFGADRHFSLESAHRRITETLTLPLPTAKVEKLKSLLDHAGNILFLLDNCGEAVIDRLLLEHYSEKTVAVVRGYPILNDITPREVEESGLGGFTIMTTGDATPGVSMKHSSQEFLEAFNRADLVVCKGQGNFETLSDVTRPIVFLLRAKCEVVCSLLGTERGSLNIIFKNID